VLVTIMLRASNDSITGSRIDVSDGLLQLAAITIIAPVLLLLLLLLHIGGSSSSCR
jgi:hypothetical protein